MLLFIFLMLEMDSARIDFIFNFKDDWTNPRIEVIFGLRFCSKIDRVFFLEVLLTCCVACCFTCLLPVGCCLSIHV